MELVISDTEIRLIYLHTISLDNQLSIKWSGKFHWKSGKSQGILFSHFCGNPEVVGLAGECVSCEREPLHKNRVREGGLPNPEESVVALDLP